MVASRISFLCMQRLAGKPCVVVLAVLEQVEGADRSHSGRFCSIIFGDSILLFVLVGGLASECAAVKACVRALVFSVCDRAEEALVVDVT
uniref:Uncharacterized protein n=1 Tax=Physcomitrium patens TaxID=3218 RepID=A0A2K1L4A7_PHYPA|nr:hypothetical protein PHYPA_003658 [Physcomitrium patens]